ncbi:MAG TPA: cytochrome c oxidase subunit II [Candidatus Thermoplasmatota archaeon]|nr:cytochrome c oxidase subunit II [Candidatus Thermoplasmatota archaeon]
MSLALFLAQDLYVPPATESAREIASLFNITLWIALFVFVFVEGLLLYIIVKFRKNTRVPRDEGHRGHTKAEVVWTVIPAGILLFLGFLSAGTLVQIDEIPDDIDHTVRVDASQFLWRFLYPDENGVAYAGQTDWCSGDARWRCSIGELRLEENLRVKLEITSRDVIHAFAVPEFAIKQDAVPGKVHVAWLQTPDVGAEPVSYHLQCMEFCGVGHHDMTARVTIFPAGSQALPYGPPTAAAPASS